MKRGFANSFEFDPAKPLTVPYGRYPHQKSGLLQVVDARTAEGVRARIANSRSEGAPGLPVYHGHPDVPELAGRFPDKAAHGWVTDCEAGAEGFRLAVAWVDEPKPGQFIYFSPYFFGDNAPGSELLIDDMQSVGLTNNPNTTRFRLPNESADDDQDIADMAGPQPEEHTMKKLLTLLQLPDTATEDEAAAALQALLDKAAESARKGEELAAETTAANEAAATSRKALENERGARIGLLLDCAIQDGRVTPATRPVWEGRLKKDFANEADALSQACAGMKTRSATPNEADGAAASPAAVLARYEGMTPGPDKDAFLRANATAINDARVAAGK
jgi:hypothetical protein